ncbi:heterokaryon incompatibility protein-domain-containing protein [Paraphoma chrysanthemicola]|uniref:Heterokaryon incompatibility protein-domain-containing protein n=1 Tax=Paraphoma chrysanthemicola TaxID=798071 RepID=A0A8K0VXJ4_9PLEO|nr:heterokaryon incompatibility protein-domain-containing protein [Paraphoma chrysanthemicola]
MQLDSAMPAEDLTLCGDFPSGDNASLQSLSKVEKQHEVALQKQWTRMVHEELGIENVGLSERDRTQGADVSMASTLEKYRVVIQRKGNLLIHKMDRLRVCTKTSREPAKRLEDLAYLFARIEELDLTREIYSDLTMTGQVNALCSALKARTRLCRLCLSVSEQLAAISHRLSEIDLNGIWPIKPEAFSMKSFTDGIRVLPPDSVPEDDPIPFNVIRHQGNGATLLASARTCPLCELLRIAIILDSFRKYGFPYDRPTTQLPQMILAIRAGYGDDEFKQTLEGIRTSRNSIYLMVDGFRTAGSKVLGHLRVIWQKPANSGGVTDGRKVVFTKLSIFESESLHLAEHISKYRPLLNSGSPEALAQIRQWLQNCRAKHRCRKTISHREMAEDELETLPTRVIDVTAFEDDSKVQLIETTGQSKANWVALSHCWGHERNHPLKTTRANLSQHLNNIAMSSLPKTFRDAVVATRALGFRYLWVDSICIVQDDEQDWYRESRLMPMIYEHATITLAASDAADSTEGLFLERPYGRIAFPSIQLPFITRDKTANRRTTLGNYTISLDWRQEPFMIHMDPAFSNIYRRGWCTQELILSRRVVHFLREGMVWVCKHTAFDETGQLLMATKRHSESDWATEWGRIIAEHSMREFTYEKDRLISLEGLAREVSKANNNSCKAGEYFFGNWLVDIPEYILWASYRTTKRITNCPSWSWASCDSAVWLRFKDFDNNRPDEGLNRGCKVIGVDAETGILRLSAVRIDIASWKLTLTGRVSQQDLEGLAGIRAYRGHLIQAYEVDIGDGKTNGWIEFDDERDALTMTKEVFFIYLAEANYWHEPQIQYWGLLLEYHPTRDDAFKRVGMGSLWGSELFKNLEQQEMAIA